MPQRYETDAIPDWISPYPWTAPYGVLHVHSQSAFMGSDTALTDAELQLISAYIGSHGPSYSICGYVYPAYGNTDVENRRVSIFSETAPGDTAAVTNFSVDLRTVG